MDTDLKIQSLEWEIEELKKRNADLKNDLKEFRNTVYELFDSFKQSQLCQDNMISKLLKD